MHNDVGKMGKMISRYVFVLVVLGCIFEAKLKSFAG